MAEPIIVVGAGGFGREVLDVIDAINATGHVWDVVGVADDNPAEANLERLQARGTVVLGTVNHVVENQPPCHFAVGVGAPQARRALAERLERAGFEPATLIHPTATQGFDVEIGPGAVICAGVRLTTNIRLGRYVHLNLNSTVGHDSTVGDFVSVNPLASISGDCIVEDDVLIGVAAVLLNQVRVGRGAIVGGSACVVRHVSAGVTVKGVPAR